jgi:N-acyl-D-amino-acid deacylase
MTGLPAQILQLKDRGILKAGNTADVTVFDFDHVKDLSSYSKSPVKPQGIDHVIISGIPALVNGLQTPNRAGKVLLKTQ